MSPQVAIIYNQPIPSRYGDMGEEKAVLGVLDEVAAVKQALDELGYPAVCVPLVPPLARAKAALQVLGADAIFNLFEGFDGCPGTEATIADFLSELNRPYTGCPGAAMALALDKPRAKEIIGQAGMRTPAYQLLSPSTLSAFHLDFPCIVKPCGEDASHGVIEESVVNDLASLKEQVTRVSRLFGGQALVEEFIDGREFNTTVLGGEVLPVSEIIYTLPPGKPRILSFGAKWEPDSIYFRNTNAVCPADIDRSQAEEISGIARKVFGLIVRRGYARVDMRMDACGRLYVLEVNPNPDISPGVGASRQAQAAGMTYSQFIDRIISLAREP